MKYIIPKRVQIETVFGCNVDCVMCAVNLPTKRQKCVMSMEVFKKIVSQLEPYKDEIEMFDVYGLGEPFLDETIIEKIRYVRSKGFRKIAISTNVSLLDDKKQSDLLDTGIETVICGINAVRKETYESIVKGVDYETVLNNTKSLIRKRNEGGFKTRFIMMFISQENNKDEWEEYREFWGEAISSDKNDLIIKYDVHTWGGVVPSFNSYKEDKALAVEPCHILFDRLMVLCDGTVPMCIIDVHPLNHPLGNINDDAVLDLFNNKKMREVRSKHLSKEKRSIEICKNCTVCFSEDSKCK